MEGRRVLVVGASSGIGRAVAVLAVAAGAQVAIAARRFDLLREVVATVSPESRDRLVPFQVDVRSEVSVALMTDAAVHALGELEIVVYSAGITHLAPLAITSADDWRRVLETNVVGAALVTRAVLPALVETSQVKGRPGRIAFLSSHSVGGQWAGLGAYVSSKAALDEMVSVWAAEHPQVFFTRIVVGPTLTGMADGWDPECAEEFFARWAAEGRFEAHEPEPPEKVAARIVAWMQDDRVPPVLDLARP
ncbi:MAG: SDR family oxidoreductase [Acidimicrobiales bacterium]|nr:SDR family oxidoreductase [Acidimicrobiales bacterium]